MKEYDVILLGAGPGGYVAAIKAAQLKLKVAVIEKEVVGGICLNHGCIPTKTILKSAKTYELFKHADKYGIKVDFKDIEIDLDKIIERKDNVVKKLTTGVAMLLKKNGVDVYYGYGEVLNKNEIKVKDETLKCKNLIIATGGTAILPPIEGALKAYEDGFLVTSREILNVKKIPQKLVIVGGGVIGVEFATIFNALGSEVTIIEMANSIITPMDDDVILEYSKVLNKSGIKILTNAAVKKINKKDVEYEIQGKIEKIKADLILMAVGIKPNIEALSKLNLKMKGRGVEVNDKMETSVKGVYAIGDVTGEHMLAHVASAEGIVAVENILGENKTINYNQIPAAIYGSPEIASIGLTERDAKAKGLDYKVTKFPLAGNGKALADGESVGFIKIIKDKKLDEILGAHIFAYNAVDMIGEFGVAMKMEATNYEVAETVHAHPSLSEIIMEAAMDKPIHI